MNEQIRVSLVQPDLIWEDPAENLERIGNMVREKVPSGTDLVLLPETFSTGFTMHAEHFAEEEPGPGREWMLSLARELNACLAGSLIVRSGGQIYNRLYWVSPGGLEGHYDKRHLFRMGREDKHFRPGESRKIFKLGAVRIMPQICYDLRFPVFARNRNDYDVLVYVASWPAPRQSVWETLLRARAIENQACVLAVSRVGVDGEGVDHLGGTCIVDPTGRVEGVLDHRPGVLHGIIDLKKIREFREQFPAWKDADDFLIR
jgi:omega-amidase